MTIKFQSELQSVLFPAVVFLLKNRALIRKNKNTTQFVQPQFMMPALLEATEKLHKDFWIWMGNEEHARAEKYPGFIYLNHLLEHEKLKLPAHDFIFIYIAVARMFYLRKKREFQAAHHSEKKSIAKKLAKMLR